MVSTGGRTGGISQRPHQTALSYQNAADQNEKTAALQTVSFFFFSFPLPLLKFLQLYVQF